MVSKPYNRIVRWDTEMTQETHVVYIATVGSSIEPIQRGIFYASPDVVYLLYGSNPRMKQRNPRIVAASVRENVKAFGLKEVTLKEIDPFSLESVMTEFIGIWQNHANDKIIANMTGGTNIMASACLLAGFTISAKVIYVRELEKGEEVPLEEQVITLPTPRIPFSALSEEKQQILRFIFKETEAGNTLLEKANCKIADHLKITPQTVSYHVKRMERSELIRCQKKGRNLRVGLTPSGLLFARMLEKSTQ